MRIDPEPFNALNRAAGKSPRYVVKIEFETASFHFTSHADIPNVPGTVFDGTLTDYAVYSQTLVPDEARTEIGAASFSVVDLGTAATQAIHSKLVAGEGLAGRLVRFYLGYEGLDFTDFALMQTQMIDSAVEFEGGQYTFTCADVNRITRADICEQAATNLSVTATITADTIGVVSTDGFEMVHHGSTYTDAPNATVGYIKIRDEIIRYTSKTSVAFLGCTRGVLGTVPDAYTADGSVAPEKREKVTEHIYLELPGVKAIYALLTGILYNDGANLPASWHLGIDPGLVRLSDFTSIGQDLWNVASETDSFVARFNGIEKTDGKAFIETELLALMGLYSPIYTDGSIGLKRMTHILPDAGAALTLDETCIVSVGPLQHDQSTLINRLRIDWNYNGDEFTRHSAFADLVSADVHRPSDVKILEYKGLYGGRHTDTIIHQVADMFWDRYSGPPERLQVQALPSRNQIEVGDVVRVKLRNVRDYVGSIVTLDRSFEVQHVETTALSGQVMLDLFGSTARRQQSAPTGAATVLADAWYTATGTNLATVSGVTITGGVMTAAPSGVWSGGSDVTAAGSVLYYNGDLTIDAGVEFKFSGNLQLRVKGFLQINGKLTGTGGGHAGVADPGDDTMGHGTLVYGNPGYVGNSRGFDGCRISQRTGNPVFGSRPAAMTLGKNPAFPQLTLKVSGSGSSATILGLPTDLRGTGGGPGGNVDYQPDHLASGGTGGAGGSGLMIVCRGAASGVNGAIDLSGLDGQAGGIYHNGARDWFAGTGGAGGPGACLVLLDGSGLSWPDLSGRFTAKTGKVEMDSRIKTFCVNVEGGRFDLHNSPFAGYPDPSVISDLDLSYSAIRIQYVPETTTASGDAASAPPPCTGLTANADAGGILWNAATPRLDSFDVVEFWISIDNDRTNAVKVCEQRGNLFRQVVPGDETRYGWVRTRKGLTPDGFDNVSTWYPVSATAGANATSSTAGQGPAGQNAISVVVTRLVALVPADSDGNVSDWTMAAGALSVFDGTTDVTSSATLSVAASTDATGTINTSSNTPVNGQPKGYYRVTALAADFGELVLRALYSGVTIDTRFSVIKSKAGAPGDAGPPGDTGPPGATTSTTDANMSASFSMVFAYADGSVPSYAGIGGYLTVYSGTTNVTSSATYSCVGTNCTGTVNAAGEYAITSMSADTASLAITITYAGVSVVRVFSVSKVRTGYEIVSSFPATNLYQGRLVFYTGDSKLYRYTGVAWTRAVDGADIIANSITTNAIAAGQITAALIASNTITAMQIRANSITANEIDSRNLTIKDGAGNIIFGASNALNYSRIIPDSFWLNTNITVNSDGTLVGAGGGKVTIRGLGYAGDLTATDGARLGVNLMSASGTVLGETDVRNAYVYIGSNGQLNGAGGGQVTLAGLNAGQLAFINSLTIGNIGTYIQSGAIGSALIGNAAILSAHIHDLEVDTIKIRDNAITHINMASMSGSTSLGTTTYVDLSGMSFTYTPDTTSDIQIDIIFTWRSTDGNDALCNVRLLRDATVLVTTPNGGSSPWMAKGSQTLSFSVKYIDTLHTTAARTYKLQGRWYGTGSGGTVYPTTTMVISEIKK